MSEIDRVQALGRIPLFSALDERQLRQVWDNCRTISIKPGQMIFGPTQKAEQFYVVLRGQVRIYKVSPRGDEQILHLYGPGETFGEAAMWAGIDYPAYAEALADGELLVVGRAALRRLIESQPELAMAMLAGLSGKLREFAQLIEELSLKDVPARLAGLLLREADAAGGPTIQLKQTKRQLAARIGTIAETFSRALAKMKAQRLIDVRGSEIEVLDRDGLERLASQ